jgi:hypothetical protein
VTSPADQLLPRLEGVRERRPGQWSARCPAHADRSPSLSIKERDDGALLLRCWSGCSVDQIVGAVGLDLADLFPRTGSAGKPSKLKLPPSQALEILNREALLIYVVGSDMHRDRGISNTDFERLAVAVRRVGRIAEAAA